jgi:hypothetical protein
MHGWWSASRSVISQGAWNEVPEASYAVSGKGDDQFLPFTVKSLPGARNGRRARAVSIAGRT